MRAPFPARAIRRTTAPELTPTSRFRWQARRGSVDALTGHVGTLVRAATGTAVDANGTTYTAGHSMPRWESRDWNGTGVRDTLGLRIAADDLAWTYNGLPETGSLLVDFSEAGTIGTSGAGLVYLGNDAVSGARLTLSSNGTNYAATIHNGTTSVTATASVVTPTSGQSVRAVVQLEDDATNWRIRLWLDVLGTAGEETTSWTSTITRAATWGATTKIRANRVGSAGTQGSTWVRQIAWSAGLLSPDEMNARL
jgi:hypothetical protein